MSEITATTTKRTRRTKAEIAALDDGLAAIIAEEAPLTVRRAFYAAETAGLVDKTDAGYEAVQRRILAMRRSGRVPYSDIVDGAREITGWPGYLNLAGALSSIGRTYRRDPWQDQPATVLFLTEKDALSTVLNEVLTRWRVRLAVMRGCSSETLIYEVAGVLDRSRTNYVYQLGDHDPTGVVAWEAFVRGLHEFAPDCTIVTERIAVTPEQIESMDLPTRPTKKTDSRAKSFVGESCEVDAIPVPVLREMVSDAIERVIDPDLWDVADKAESQERANLRRLIGGAA